MKFNSMNGDNDIKKDYSKYFILAIVFAFVFAFFLNIAAKLIILAAGVLIKFWWVGLLAILGLLLLRKLGRKRK